MALIHLKLLAALTCGQMSRSMNDRGSPPLWGIDLQATRKRDGHDGVQLHCTILSSSTSAAHGAFILPSECTLLLLIGSTNVPELQKSVPDMPVRGLREKREYMTHPTGIQKFAIHYAVVPSGGNGSLVSYVALESTPQSHSVP
jgi:hypothetical protein